MPRKTKLDLENALDSAEKRANLAETALLLVLKSAPDASERYRDESGAAKIRLYGAARSHGGIIIETHEANGWTNHAYLDDAMSAADRYTAEMGGEYTRRDALARLVAVRRSMLTLAQDQAPAAV